MSSRTDSGDELLECLAPYFPPGEAVAIRPGARVRRRDLPANFDPRFWIRVPASDHEIGEAKAVLHEAGHL